MMRYPIHLEIDQTGRCYAHVLDLPGCHLRASSQEEALSRLPNAIRQYHHWLRQHGEPAPSADETIELEVAAIQMGEGPFDPGDTAALLTPDQRPLTSQEMEACFRLASYQRDELMHLVRHLPEEVLDWQPDPDTYSIRRILRHIGNAEEWYVSRIVPPDTLPPEWEHDEDLPLLEFLEMERRTAVARLRELTTEERRGVFYPTHFTSRPEEPWTARKALRRFLEHEREHTAQIRDIASTRRDPLVAHLANERANLLYHLIGLDEIELTSLSVLGNWTVKDLLAHIAAWDRWELQVMQQMASGDSPDFSAVKNMGAYNAAVVREWKDKSLEQVLSELQAARKTWVEWLLKLPLATFYQPRKYRRYDWSFPACVEIQWKHDAEHGKHIASWREAQGLEFAPWPKTGAKATLLAALGAQREDLLARIALIPPEQRETKLICGEWTLKDVVGHVADWERWVLEGLHQMAQGENPSVENVEDVEAWNQSHTEARREQTWDRVWEDFQTARSEAQGLLAGMSQDDLMRSYAAPWGGESTPYGWAYVCLEHDREHCKISEVM
ncbi:MAG: DinB family protein [Chloroflexota bacterium]